MICNSSSEDRISEVFFAKRLSADCSSLLFSTILMSSSCFEKVFSREIIRAATIPNPIIEIAAIARYHSSANPWKSDSSGASISLFVRLQSHGGVATSNVDTGQSVSWVAISETAGHSKAVGHSIAVGQSIEAGQSTTVGQSIAAGQAGVLGAEGQWQSSTSRGAGKQLLPKSPLLRRNKVRSRPFIIRPIANLIFIWWFLAPETTISVCTAGPKSKKYARRKRHAALWIILIVRTSNEDCTPSSTWKSASQIWGCTRALSCFQYLLEVPAMSTSLQPDELWSSLELDAKYDMIFKFEEIWKDRIHFSLWSDIKHQTARFRTTFL